MVCTNELWTHKVLVKHPIMKGLEGDVKQTIEKPDYNFIYQDVASDQRNVYYRLLRKRNLYIKVVVEFDDAYSGRVITAFLASRPKGEKLIWPISSH